jgi:hypothetical protein
VDAEAIKSAVRGVPTADLLLDHRLHHGGQRVDGGGPFGALSATVLGTPVSMLTPPMAMMVPLGAPKE